MILIEATFIGLGIAAALMHGKFLKIMMVRWGVIIDILLAFMAISTMAQAGAAAAAFGRAICLVLIVFLCFVRYFMEHKYESDWTKKDYYRALILVGALGWFPMIWDKSIGVVLWICLTTFIWVGFKPYSAEKLAYIKDHRYITYFRFGKKR
jgi:protein-S-isoprenylcysteine O-methyltransferase Ste14